MSDAVVISCQSVCKTYEEGPAPVSVLSGVELSVSQGEMLAIIGASGVGKSTLLQVLGGLDTPSSGEVLVCGRSMARMTEKERTQWRNQHIGFVYQMHHLLPEFDVCENVMMPLLIRGGVLAESREKALHYLDAVSLSHRLLHRTQELSGGERQRVAIARALVTEPACILADEPTGNLDEQTADQVFSLICDLNQQVKTSVVLVTHNLQLAKRLHRAVVLKEGALVEVS